MLVVNDVAAGTKLLIAGGLTAEVIENMGNGEWLRVRPRLRPGPVCAQVPAR